MWHLFNRFYGIWVNKSFFIFFLLFLFLLEIPSRLNQFQFNQWNSMLINYQQLYMLHIYSYMFKEFEISGNTNSNTVRPRLILCSDRHFNYVNIRLFVYNILSVHTHNTRLGNIYLDSWSTKHLILPTTLFLIKISFKKVFKKMENNSSL